jgi:DTW domain-containing protein YfiP
MPGLAPHRCPTCFSARCFCAHIRPVETSFSILIVRHAAEILKPSNTARLAALALPRCRIVEHASVRGPLDPAELEGEETWLLYPEGEAATPGRPPARLIVLDGTWQQTRRMRQRLPVLRRLPILRLPAPPARTRMRRPTRADGMSTLEAIARAVAMFDGEAAAAPLEALHAAAVRANRAFPE